MGTAQRQGSKRCRWGTVEGRGRRDPLPLADQALVLPCQGIGMPSPQRRGAWSMLSSEVPPWEQRTEPAAPTAVAKAAPWWLLGGIELWLERDHS